MDLLKEYLQRGIYCLGLDSCLQSQRPGYYKFIFYVVLSIILFVNQETFWNSSRGSPEYYQAVNVENEVQNMKKEMQNMRKSKNSEMQTLKSNIKLYEVRVVYLNEKLGNLNGKIKEFEAIITVITEFSPPSWLN